MKAVIYISDKVMHIIHIIVGKLCGYSKVLKIVNHTHEIFALLSLHNIKRPSDTQCTERTLG